MSKRRTKEYLTLEKKECPGCHHHGRDVRLRKVKRSGEMKIRCNNCVGSSF